MKEERLKELLDKYYNGDTSEEEEFLLRQYFSGENVLPGYEAENEIFNYYSDDINVNAPADDLEARLIDSIELLEKKRMLRKRFIRSGLGMAATVLVLLGTYFFFLGSSEPKDTFSDPRIAYAETKRILYDVSVRLNRGTQALQHVVIISNAAQAGRESMQRSADIISNQFEKIVHLDDILYVNDKKK